MGLNLKQGIKKIISRIIPFAAIIAFGLGLYQPANSLPLLKNAITANVILSQPCEASFKDQLCSAITGYPRHSRVRNLLKQISDSGEQRVKSPLCSPLFSEIAA